jgi:FdhD protein
MSATVEVETLVHRYDGAAAKAGHRTLAVEHPIAFEVNGFAYAVMMATPTDLQDFAFGFALSEGLIESADELLDISISEVEGGAILRLVLSDERAEPVRDRVRMRVSEGSCGLCGLESISEVLRPLQPVKARIEVAPSAVGQALEELPSMQAEGARTGAMHAAAFCAPDGKILALREDVGRHNALDKLIGALAREGADPASGFMLVSARCSYELVEKTVRAGCAMLVAISAPTSLAVERARTAGLTLVALARHDTMLVLTDSQGILKETSHGL